MAVLALALALFAPGGALGQTVCPHNEPELFPFSGATDVPRNGIVRVLYRDAADAPGVTGGEAERVIEVYQGGRRLAGSATLENDPTGVGREAVWTSEALLPANEVLEATFEDAFRTPVPFSFETGEAIDDGPPVFDGASKVEIVASDGGVLDEDAYRVRVGFPLADDAVGAGNVEYVVYQTDGPDWARPVERARVRCVIAGSSGIAAFEIPVDEIGRWACFEVRAVDFYGRSEGNDHEACGIPEGPGHFRSICSVAGPGEPASSPLPLVILAVALGRRREKPMASGPPLSPRRLRGT